MAILLGIGPIGKLSYLRRVEALHPDAGIEGVGPRPGLVPVALEPPLVVKLLAELVEEPPGRPALVPWPGVRQTGEELPEAGAVGALCQVQLGLRDLPFGLPLGLPLGQPHWPVLLPFSSDYS